MNILVTGGLGFVGFNLARDLARSGGCAVIAADLHDPTPEQEAVLQAAGPVRCARLDVRDRPAYARLVETGHITHIVHAAAVTPSDQMEREQAPLVTEINLNGALNALAIGYEQPGVERVLLVSSSGVYGFPPADPFSPQREEGPLALNNLYAVTKHAAELVAARYAALSGKPMAAVRLGSVYGPFEHPGKSRQQVSQVQRMANALREGRRMRLYGPDVARDWVYTADISAAVRALLSAPRWNYPVYNIGSPVPVSFSEVAAAFQQLGLQVEWVTDPASADLAMLDASRRAPLSLERLQADTGFTPRFTFAAALQDYLAPKQS